MSNIITTKGRCHKCGADMISRGKSYIAVCTHCGNTITPDVPRVVNEPKEIPKTNITEEDPKLYEDQSIYISTKTWDRLREYSLQNTDIPKYNKNKSQPTFNDIIVYLLNLSDKFRKGKKGKSNK